MNVEEDMRKTLLAAAATAAVFTVGLVSSANALTPATANGVRAATESTGIVQDVRWVCRYRWDGRRCWWVPGPAYGYYPYYHRRWYRRW